MKGVTLDFSRPGKPTDNAFIESFNGKFRAECLNAHWFMSLDDAVRKCEAWRDIVSSAMHLSSQNALGQAGLLIGRDRLIRLNAPLLPSGPIGLDDVKRAKAELPDVAKQLAFSNGPSVASRFFSEKAEPYVPFYPEAL